MAAVLALGESGLYGAGIAGLDAVVAHGLVETGWGVGYWGGWGLGGEGDVT